MEQIKQISEVEEIGKKVQLLQNNELPEYKAYLDEAENFRKIRHESLEEYKKLEIAAAHKNHEGTKYIIDSQFEHRANLLGKQIQKQILLKKELLFSEFPEIAKIFTETAPDLQIFQNFDQFLIENNQSDDLSEKPKNEYKASLGKGQLIPKKEIEQSVTENIKTFSIRNNSLLENNNVYLEIGDTVCLELQKELSYKGVIRSFLADENLIEIGTNNGTNVKIPVSALNFGIAELVKL